MHNAHSNTIHEKVVKLFASAKRCIIPTVVQIVAGLFALPSLAHHAMVQYIIPIGLVRGSVFL